MKLAYDSIIGILIGVALFVFAIVSSTDNYFMFLDTPSLMMVLGGTLAGTMISYKGGDVYKSLKALLTIFLPTTISSKTLYLEVEKLIGLSRLIKRDGLVGVETKLGPEFKTDAFLKYAVDLLISGYRGDELRKMLSNFTETNYERSLIHSHILKTMGTLAPGFGMLGTVIGLVIMLDNLGSDPRMLGKGLAFALITTLYGVLFSSLVFKPASEKLRQKEELHRFRNLLLTEGFVLVGESRESMLIQDMMNSFLDPESHFSLTEVRSIQDIVKSDGQPTQDNN